MRVVVIFYSHDERGAYAAGAMTLLDEQEMDARCVSPACKTRVGIEPA